MNDSAWRLPSMRAWLDKALADLDDGACVVLRLPQTMSATDVFDVVRDRRPAVWCERVLLAPDQTLVDALTSLSGGRKSLEEALARLAGDGTVAWFDVRHPLHAEDLERIAEAHRHASDAPRALVVEHRGPLTAGGRPSPTLRIHHLYAALTALDSHVLLSQAAPQISPSRRYEIAELAAYDLELAVQLAMLERPSHEKYADACRARAEALGLSAPVKLPDVAHIPLREPRGFDAAWQTGAFDVFDGNPILHAGLSPDDDFRRRLWRGQVRALLPFLDEMRLNLLDAAARKGLSIFPSGGDTVELIDVLRALERGIGNHELTRAAREMTRARNDLAHLRLVDEERRQRLREVIRSARLKHIAAL